jgi:integrase
MNETISPDLRLEVRKNSKFIQVVLKGPDKKWHRFSSKSTSREIAVEFGRKKLAEWSVLEEHGISVGAKSFRYVAERYIKDMKAAEASGNVKASHGHYIATVTKWFLPYFGDKKIDKIDEGAVADFEDYRRNRMGREPAKSTINKHNIALRSVLEFAVRNKWIKRHSLPKLTIKNKGVETERRGFFEPQEWNKLVEFLHNWPKNGKKEITKYKRNVLASYVYLITMSGLRPGKEADLLRWSDFQYVPASTKNPEYYKIFIRSGKKAGRGKRTPDEKAHRFVVVDLGLIEELKSLKFFRNNDVLEDDLVFCMPDGSPISGFSEMFRKALDATGLRVGISGEPRTLYSLRHTYATWNLRRGVTYEQLKSQMGTSITMLQKHYDHATADTWADALLLGQVPKSP